MSTDCTQPVMFSRILVGSPLSEPIQELIQSRGYEVIVADLSSTPSKNIHVIQSVQIVLLDVTRATTAIAMTIRDLTASIVSCDVAPRLLCFSTAHRNPQFVLHIERLGARYARVSDAVMLLEAIDLVKADLEGPHKKRPTFQILHGFALDRCHEGESVEAILFPGAAADPQLRLALSERLTFNFLAEHSRLSFDARQIAAALNGLPFYREHAANSGVLQRVKIRVPTVKVIIGRLRKAMALKFAESHLRIDPLDVLQSFLAVGSNRVLYRLNADCKITHSHE